MATLPLSDKIQQTSTHKRKHNIIRAAYGDGYEQVASWGINNKMDFWTLNYTGLSFNERNLLLNSYDLTTVWEWIPFGKALDKSWSYTGDFSESSNGNVYTVKLKIKQVFTL